MNRDDLVLAKPGAIAFECLIGCIYGTLGVLLVLAAAKLMEPDRCSICDREALAGILPIHAHHDPTFH